MRHLNEYTEFYYDAQVLEEELSGTVKETGDSRARSEFLSHRVLGKNK